MQILLSVRQEQHFRHGEITQQHMIISRVRVVYKQANVSKYTSCSSHIQYNTIITLQTDKYIQTNIHAAAKFTITKSKQWLNSSFGVADDGIGKMKILLEQAPALTPSDSYHIEEHTAEGSPSDGPQKLQHPRFLLIKQINLNVHAKYSDEGDKGTNH